MPLPGYHCRLGLSAFVSVRLAYLNLLYVSNRFGRLWILIDQIGVGRVKFRTGSDGHEFLLIGQGWVGLVSDRFGRHQKESPRERRRARESPGEPRRAQESPGESTRRAQESPGESRRAQESRGEPSRAQEQESPGEPSK